MGYSRKKSTPPRQKAREVGGGGGGGVMAMEIQTGRGSEPKNTSSGVTFNFTDVSIIIASINKFSKIALRFLILLFFQTTDLLPHLF